MKSFTLMILVTFLTFPISGFASELLKFHRWNEGFRVESEAAYVMEVGEEEFDSLMADPDQLINKLTTPLYTGCYAVEKTGERAPASAEESKAKFYKICLHSESKPKDAQFLSAKLSSPK